METDSAKWHNLFRLFVQKDKRAEEKPANTSAWKQPLKSSVEYTAILTPESMVVAIYIPETGLYIVPVNFGKTSYFSNRTISFGHISGVYIRALNFTECFISLKHS